MRKATSKFRFLMSFFYVKQIRPQTYFTHKTTKVFTHKTTKVFVKAHAADIDQDPVQNCMALKSYYHNKTNWFLGPSFFTQKTTNVRSSPSYLHGSRSSMKLDALNKCNLLHSESWIISSADQDWRPIRFLRKTTVKNYTYLPWYKHFTS